MQQPLFTARRSPVLGRGGMVSSSQPLATGIGLRILQAGGNAADAAVAVAAALQLTEPCSTGLGGDAFVLFYDAATRAVQGLNGSGRSPRALTLDVGVAASPAGADGLPSGSAHCVTVPGAAALWCDTAARWGRLPLSAVLQPAADLARAGFPVSPITAHYWQAGEAALRRHAPASCFGELLTPAGRAPRAGEIFRNPALADALSRLAEGGADAGFYRGRTGAAIVEAVRAAGGLLAAEDLAAHASEFVAAPISVVHAGSGVRVWELPPNGQGLAALLALNNVAAVAARADAGAFFGDGAAAAMPDYAATSPAGQAARRRQCEGGGASASGGAAAAPSGGACSPLRRAGHNSAAYLHVLLESMRLAFADARRHVADPALQPAPLAALLAPGYAATRVASLAPQRALADVRAGAPLASCDTVSFSVVDGDGNAASFINSNYMGFGSGIVPRGCGFSLQNRGANFVLTPGHANALAPAKRPYHTIIPGLATHDDTGELYAAFSVMGGFMQPQGHAQVLLNMLEFGMDPQAALDAPRFCIADGAYESAAARGAVLLEAGIGADVAGALAAYGHSIAPPSAADVGFAHGTFGRGQIICRDRDTGVLWGGSDGRGDGCAAGW